MQLIPLSGEIADSSDESLSAAIQRRLSATGNHSLRQIECDYCDGLVVLRGRVPTYYLKQLAQSLLLADPAVLAIENQIEVVSTGCSSTSDRG